jgi:cation diffusion facilitator family transporter
MTTRAHDHDHHGHGHSHGLIDRSITRSREGLRTVAVSLGVLLVTAAAQTVIFVATGSVALLADLIHNFGDALTAIPLGIAFVLGRRAVTRRFTYGLGRAEDLAGLVILLVITGSSAVAGYESIMRLIEPQDMRNIGWVAAAGVLGFVGNELVARYRIRIGREIGSAALVADGLHARTDGFTSLSVLLSAGGAALGWRWADPVVGILITVAILSVLVGAAREVFSRVLDAVDPVLVDKAERALTETPDVLAVDQVRMRWVGHVLHAEADLAVDPKLSLSEAHRIAHEAEHRLLHALPRLGRAVLHAHPAGPHGDAEHELVAHHRN